MKKIFVINSESMGNGNFELGKQLMVNFFRKLAFQDFLPQGIIFYNAGVKLLAQGSSILPELDVLEKKGVDLIAGGTCVNFFGLQEKILVGRVSNMEEIVSHLCKAERVVTI